MKMSEMSNRHRQTSDDHSQVRVDLTLISTAEAAFEIETAAAVLVSIELIAVLAVIVDVVLVVVDVVCFS